MSSSLDSAGLDRVCQERADPISVLDGARLVPRGRLRDLIEIREGNALETLTSDVPNPVDLVVLHGTKSPYLPILQLLESHLTTGSIIVADNASRSAGYQPYVRTRGTYVSTNAGGDVEISMMGHPAATLR